MRVNFEELEPRLVEEFLLDTYEGKPFTGIAYETWANGGLRSEAEFVDGLKSGLSKDWFQNGQIKSEMNLRQGDGHGLSQTWYENGQLKSQTICEYGIKLSEKVWDNAGLLTRNFQLKEDDFYYSILKRRREESATF